MSNDFRGYILQVKVKGRTELQHEISRLTEEDYKQFIESINEELSCLKYFMWVDSIIFRTTSLKQDLESLKAQNSIFEDLEQVISACTMDSKHMDQLVKNWGSIWKEQLYTENIDEDKFDFDEETIADIIAQAKELLIEKLSEVLEIT